MFPPLAHATSGSAACLLAPAYNCPASFAGDLPALHLYPITLRAYPYALQYAELSNTTYPNLSKTVFAIFMVLVPILLLNMLIAMMGNTYAHVIEQSEKEFVKQVSVRSNISFHLYDENFTRNERKNIQEVKQ